MKKAPTIRPSEKYTIKGYSLFILFLTISFYSLQAQIKPTNSSFESPVTSNFTYTPTGDAWSYNSGSGLVKTGSGFGNPAPPNGDQAAFLQNVGATITQSITLGAGIYAVSFYSSQRPGNAKDQQVELSFGSTIIDSITPSGQAFAKYTTKSFSTDGGTMNLQFKNLISGDNTIFLDDITITLLSEVNMDMISNPAAVFINSGSHSISLTGISNSPIKNINISATSDNPSVITNTFSIAPNPVVVGQNNAVLNYTAGSQAGTAHITVKAYDGTNSIERTFSVKVVDPNAPSFDLPEKNTVYYGRGFDYIIIPNVSNEKGGDITFSYVNNTAAVLEVVSIDYTQGNKVAVLKVKANTIGDATVTLTAKGDAGTYSQTLNISVKIFHIPGINTAYYDLAFWQTLTDDATPHPGSLKIVQSANYPFQYLTLRSIWKKMWGYITPTVTGEYHFKTVTNYANSKFYLSTDASISNKKPIASYENNITTPSDAINLIAGNTYYWESSISDYDAHEWSVFVAPPDEAYSYMDGTLSSPIFDTIAPTAVKNLKKITTGVNDLYVQWDESKDNAFMGYFLYVNGIKQSDTIHGTNYLVKNLQPGTSYSLMVRAFDLYENGSLPSNTLTLKTYPIDNTPPTVPGAPTLVKAYDLGLQLAWTPSTDGETEIRGYNIYYEGSNTPINIAIVKDPTYLITNLAIKTTYKIQIEAVDAAYNKSAKSAVSSFTTPDFDISSTVPGFKKGRLQFSMTPIAKSTGLGVNGEHYPGSFLMRNKTSNPGFEAADPNMGHEVSPNSVYSLVTGADVYAGAKSARISGAAGDYLRSPFNMHISGDKKYTVRFAMKRPSTSKATVRVTITSLYGVTLFDKSYTPTDTWVIYEDQVLPTAWGNGEGVGFYVNFNFATAGSIFLDEIQFMPEGDDYMVSGKLSPYSKYGMGLLNQLKPSALRLGGITPNSDSFKDHVGYHQNNFTYAEWIEMANLVGAKTTIVTGVNTTTDWYTDNTTHTKFMDYIAGDASTAYGKIRIEQSGFADLMAGSPGVLMELGNEVWGGTAHGAPAWEGNGTAYGAWARASSTAAKLSTGYLAHSDKIWTSYSGGFTDYTSFGAWTRKAYTGDKGEVDWLAISGYMGGNLGYSPEVPRGKSELDYHKNTISQMVLFWTQMYTMQKDMIKTIGHIKPIYMYEGNMTRPDYHGKLGQAINFTDYYASNIEKGAVTPNVFLLAEGSEWGILEDRTRKPLPLFHTTALFNSHCKGAVVKTNFLSADTLVDENGTKIEAEPVSVHTYVNGDTYTIMMLSRDFENNYRVQIELPDSIKASKGYTMYTITGDALQSTDVKEDSVVNTTQNLDSMLVTIAPYSMMVIKFKANSYTLKTPAEGVLVNSKKVTSIDVTSSTGVFAIPDANGSLVLTAKLSPDDAFIGTFTMTVPSNKATGSKVTALGNGKFMVQGATTAGNITVRFKADDGSGVTKDVIISVISGLQGSTAAYNVSISPNPTSGIVNIDIPEEARGGLIKLYTLTGLLISEKAISSGLESLDLSKQPQGIYILQIVDSEGLVTRKKIERL